MDQNLQQIYEQVMQAVHPEDLFGAVDLVLPDELLIGAVRERFETMRAVVDPGNYREPADVEGARDAFRALTELYERAVARMRRHHYGVPGWHRAIPAGSNRSFEVGAHRYYLEGTPTVEDPTFATYPALMTRNGEVIGDVLIKLATSTEGRTLIEREARALDRLHRAKVPQWKHLPLLFDRFEAGGQPGLVFRGCAGFTLREVREHRHHREGVDQRHMVWILDRLLSVLGYAHRCGIVHGALTPDTVVVQPASHNVILSGWARSAVAPAVTGERIEEPPLLFSPPETIAHGEIGPWSDLYALGKLMIWVLGGDPQSNSLPAGIAPEWGAFLRSLVHEERNRRPADAWEVYETQNRIKDALWPRRFLHFDMA